MPSGNLILDKLQFGTHTTDANNFVFQTNNNGSMSLLRGSAGNLGTVLNISASGVITFPSQPISFIKVNTGNGFGTTNTRIRRFLNITNGVNHAVIQGGDISVVDSVANGTSFVINSNGFYSISYSLDWSPSGSGGISLNSTELSTDLSVITNLSHRLVLCSATGSGVTSVSWTGYLNSGDVLRPHTDGTGVSIAARNNFTIYKISN